MSNQASAFVKNNLLAIVSVVSATSVLLAILAWGQGLLWHILDTSTYLLFPIFGLIAFSLLWSQYVAIALRRLVGVEDKKLSNYFTITGWLVLLTILLHPGLLIWQLWRDGAGLPPGSELSYVMPSLKAFIILGVINLAILLLFELRRIFAQKPWWKYFGYLVDITMLSIFIHGLKLGTQLQTGWYRYVWLFYGLTLVVLLLYIHLSKQPAETTK